MFKNLTLKLNNNIDTDYIVENQKVKERLFSREAGFIWRLFLSMIFKLYRYEENLYYILIYCYFHDDLMFPVVWKTCGFFFFFKGLYYCE